MIDWGFRVKHADGSTSPAGAILRQAHKRAPGEVSMLDKDKSLAVELVLRKYGITSVGAHREELKDVLHEGGKKARARIKETTELVRERMGIVLY